MVGLAGYAVSLDGYMGVVLRLQKIEGSLEKESGHIEKGAKRGC